MSPNTSNILFPYLFPGGQSKVSPSLSSPFRKEKYSGHTSFMFSLTYFSPMPLSYSHLTKPKSILEAISLTPRFSTHKSKQMTNLLILLCSLSLLSLPSSFQQLAEFDYTGFNQIGPNITLSGSSEIMKSGILQLTNDTTRIMGHAFYTSPIQFKNSPNSSVFSFSTCFAFVIVPEYPLLGGHGLAFALSPSRDLQSAEPSLYLGLMNSSNDGNFSNHLFAVEFDTFQDIKFKDINDNHIGIDMNSLESNESVTAAYYTKDLKKQDLNLKGGKPILVWIDYDSISTQINVTVSPSNSKPELPIISYKYDLSPLLYESMFVGFSASTGQVAGSHYLLGWSFKINGTAESLSLNSLPSLPRPKKKPTVLIIGVSVSSFVFLIGAILSGLYLLWKIKNTEVIEDWELGIGPHRYSYQELNQATRGFKDSELLGAGGFGRVYKGTLPNSMAHVAVKQISHNSRQGFPEFFSEITSIGRLRHRNLVQLLGWCRRGDDLLLVYDFMPNGSLDKFLFDKPATILNWQQRFNIIKGVASALLYLHEGYEQIVIHRDVKASNVLLDNELNGRLGDFGLAKLYEHGATPCTTHVVGTIGYLAPEYAKTGKASTNSDVFAFGTLLLEVVCGRRPIKPKAAPRELVLVDWVWDMWQEGDVFGVVDPNLKGAFDETEVWMVLKLGLMCSNEVPMVRPSLRQVVRYLEGEVPLPNDLRPPWEVKSGWRMGGGGSGSGEGFEGFNGFDGYENMLLSSSTFEKGSGNSFRRSRDVDASYGSISLQSTGDAR